MEGNLSQLENWNYNTKIILLVCGMVTAIPFFNFLIRDVFKILFLISLFLTVRVLYVHRKDKPFASVIYLFMALFCCSYLITIMVVKNHVINEIAILGFLMMQFYFLTYYNQNDKETEYQHIVKFINLFNKFAFYYSIIILVMFLMGIDADIKIFGKLYPIGIWDGQLGGLYNPNTAATISWLSIAASFTIMRNGASSKYLKANLVLQSLVLCLTQSRGGLVCMCLYVIFNVLSAKKPIEIKKLVWFKFYLKRIFVGLFLSLLIVLSSNMVVNLGEFYINHLSPCNYIAQHIYGKHSDNQIFSRRKERKIDNADEFTTGRSKLWKIGLKAFDKNKPLGIGFRSIDDHLRNDLNAGGYKNSAAGGLHNGYLTVLVSSGITGFIFFLGILILLLSGVYKLLFRKNCTGITRQLCIVFLVMLISELIESRIIFGLNYYSIIFWLIAGYIIRNGLMAKTANRSDKYESC